MQRDAPKAFASFFFSSRRRHTRWTGDWSSDVCSSDLVLEGDRETPMPWSNVLANAEFGTIVSSSGSMFTWAANSRENRSEERRVGKECRCRGSRYQEKKK